MGHSVVDVGRDPTVVGCQSYMKLLKGESPSVTAPTT